MPDFYIIDNISEIQVDLDGSPWAYAYDEKITTNGFLNGNGNAKNHYTVVTGKKSILLIHYGGTIS